MKHTLGRLIVVQERHKRMIIGRHLTSACVATMRLLLAVARRAVLSFYEGPANKTWRASLAHNNLIG